MVDQVNGEGSTRSSISVERNRRSVEEVDESINDDHDMVSTGPGSQCKHKTVGHVSVGVGLSIFGGEALTGLFAELLLQDHDKVVGYGSKHETEAEPCEHPEQAAQGIENVGDAEASIDQVGADVTSLRARVEVPETSVHDGIDRLNADIAGSQRATDNTNDSTDGIIVGRVFVAKDARLALESNVNIEGTRKQNDERSQQILIVGGLERIENHGVISVRPALVQDALLASLNDLGAALGSAISEAEALELRHEVKEIRQL